MKKAFVAGTALLLSAGHALAQRAVEANWPTKPIRLIVPQAPGGSNDIMARYIGGQIAERWGKQIVVDNRPGAEGMIGSELVARAAPDGYTLLMASTAFTMNPAMLKKMPYDPLKDFDFATIFGRAPVMITVGAVAAGEFHQGTGGAGQSQTQSHHHSVGGRLYAFCVCHVPQPRRL